jgi:CRP/FNR family cyclic AMP-dependent transcriptional regulator
MERASKRLHFGPTNLSLPASLSGKIVTYKAGQIIFSVGEPDTHVFHIRKGTVKLSVLSARGKEAVIAILSDGNFLGEEGLAGQRFHLSIATTISSCTVQKIKKPALMHLLHQDVRFYDQFTSYLISRTIKVEEDLADQLFNLTEKRLARALLLLAHYGNEEKPAVVRPKISQATLADMIGTTRSRVSTFMNKFRKMGFIEYNDGLHVHSSLLRVALNK